MRASSTSSLGINPPKASLRDWLGLAALMLPVLLVAVDNTVLSLAVPHISAALAPSASQQLWMIDIYPLILAALLLVMGNLGDKYGRRRMLILGSIGFTIVSVLAAFAPSAELLIAARAAMAFFGAMLMPSTLGLLRGIFINPGQRRLAIAIWSSMFAGGAALGPLVGGFILDGFGWWGAVFILAVPIMVPMLIAVPLTIKEQKPQSASKPIDILSVALSIISFGSFVYLIKHLAVDGVDPLTLVLALVAVVAGFFFIRRQGAISNPILQLELFRNRNFSVALILNALSLMTMTGLMFFAAQHLQLVLGLTATESALVQLPGAALGIIMGLGAVLLAKLLGVRGAITLGLLFSASGYGMAAILGGGIVPMAFMIIFVLCGIGVGISETLTNDVILSNAPVDRAGAASAISESAYEIGSVLGTAVLGSILTASYRSHLSLPGGLPADLAAQASQTLGSALHVAQSTGGMLGAEVAEAARIAFESGVTVTTGFGAILMIAAALLAWFGLKLRSPKSEVQAPADEIEDVRISTH